MGKTKWPPRSLDFSSKTTERNSRKVDRKQDLKILYQVCVFFGRSVNKNGHPGWSVKKVAHCTQVHVMWPFGPLVLFIFRHLKNMKILPVKMTVQGRKKEENQLQVYILIHIWSCLPHGDAFNSSHLKPPCDIYSTRYSKAQILRTRIIRIHAYSEVISIPRQNPFKMIRKNEG